MGTPLVVEGLEFDQALGPWESHRDPVEGLYVAITRAAKSLTNVSRSRRPIPAAQ